MRRKPPKNGLCASGNFCHEGHLCDYCLPYGHKKVFTDEQEAQIDKWLAENRKLMDDLVKSGD